MEKSPSFSEYAKFTANDGASKLVSSRKLPFPDNETMDVAVELYDEEEDGPNAKSKKFTISLQLVIEHETATLQR